MKVKISKVPTLQKVKIKAIPKAQNGIEPSANSVHAELEQGEVYQSDLGNINKVPESEPTHEDGGSVVPNVSRVLEDTGDKREDEDSKILKMSPEEVENTTGFKPNKSLTHSKAFEKSSEYWDKQLNKVQKKIKKSYDDAKNTNSPFAKNSLKHNIQQLNNIPTKEQLFQNLFDHQESTKQQFNINDSGEKAQNGGRIIPSTFIGTDGKLYYSKPGEITNPEMYNTTVQSLGLVRTTPQIDLNRLISPDQVLNPQYSNNNDYGDNTYPDDFNPIYGLPNQPTVTSIDNRFNEPLHWYDLAGPIAKLADSSRIPTQYNGVNLVTPHIRQLDVRPELESNQASFNALRNILPNTTTGNANLANLASQKYRIDNQLIGQYENINKGKKDQEDQILAETANKQQLLNQQARAVQEQQQLRGLDAARLNRISSIDEIANRFAQNAKLNREGNLLMHMVNYFDQNGNYNGKRYNFTLPSGTIPSTQQQSSNLVNIGTNPYTGQPEYRYKITTPTGKTIYVKPVTKALPMGLSLFGR